MGAWKVVCGWLVRLSCAEDMRRLRHCPLQTTGGGLRDPYAVYRDPWTRGAGHGPGVQGLWFRAVLRPGPTLGGSLRPQPPAGAGRVPRALPPASCLFGKRDPSGILGQRRGRGNSSHAGVPSDNPRTHALPPRLGQREPGSPAAPAEGDGGREVPARRGRQEDRGSGGSRAREGGGGTGGVLLGPQAGRASARFPSAQELGCEERPGK